MKKLYAGSKKRRRDQDTITELMYQYYRKKGDSGKKKEAAFYVGLGKEQNYNHAVRILKEIRTIMKKNKWTEEWNSRYNFIMQFLGTGAKFTAKDIILFLPYL